MRICLVNAPWEENDRWGIRAGCRFPNLMIKHTNSYVPFPFLLAYTASCLEQRGHEVLLVDGVAERTTVEKFCAGITGFAPDLIIAETSTTSMAFDLAVLAHHRKMHRKVHIAVYGPHASARPQDLLTGVVDSVMRGEPELTTVALAEALSDGRDLRTVPGLVLHDDKGNLIETDNPQVVNDIDALPYPKRQGLPMEHYAVPGFPAPTVFMYGSRGCPFKCNFCLWPQTLYDGTAYRPRAPEKIADEIAYVLRNWPTTRSIFFDDDTFNIGRKRLMAFANALEARAIRIPWGMNARADHWDEELLRCLRDTGLFTLRIGIESGDPDVLRRCGKDIDLGEARAMLLMSDRLGIQNHLSFVIGLPGETRQSIENTIRFIRSVPAASIQFSVAVPFPGTAFYRDVEKAGHLISRDWSQYSGHDRAVMRTDALSPQQILEAVTHARRRTYFSARFILRRLRYLRDLRDLQAIIRKGLLLLGLPHWAEYRHR
jgi:Fe-S oxidoreductase